MKNTLIDIAMSIDGFKHIEELIGLINHESPFLNSHVESKRVFNGIQLILRELQDDISLQRNTLAQTMLHVRNQYAVLNRHRHTAQQMNAITMAIGHVKYCLKRNRMSKQIRSVS